VRIRASSSSTGKRGKRKRGGKRNANVSRPRTAPFRGGKKREERGKRGRGVFGIRSYADQKRKKKRGPGGTAYDPFLVAWERRKKKRETGDTPWRNEIARILRGKKKRIRRQEPAA